MTYTIRIFDKEIEVSDQTFQPLRKKPTLAIIEGNTSTKIASFNDKESMMMFLSIFGVNEKA